MNKHLSFAFQLAVVANFAALDSQAACKRNSARNVGRSIFFNSTSNTRWLAIDEQQKGFFSYLRFVPEVQTSKKAVKARKLMNEVDCSDIGSLNMSYQSTDGRFTLFVRNNCQKQVAKKLGFKAFEIENYGSMEAGEIIPWEKLLICPRHK